MKSGCKLTCLQAIISVFLFALGVFAPGKLRADSRLESLYQVRESEVSARFSTPELVKSSRVAVRFSVLRKRHFYINISKRQRLEARRTKNLRRMGRHILLTANLYRGKRKAGRLTASFAGRSALYIHLELYRARKIYTVEKADRTRYVLRIRENENFRGCGVENFKMPDDKLQRVNSSADVVQSTAGAVVRVLVGYTPATAGAGAAQIETEIVSAISLANQTYLNSGIDHRIELAGIVPVPEAESGGMETDLYDLRYPGAGYEKWDNMLTLREEHSADCVSVVVESGDYCGIAFFGSHESALFSIVARGCFSNHSFTHELGHNMAARHDAANTGAGPYIDGYGWRFTGNSGTQYRTVMAYSPGIRIPYFSNPDVFYDDVATGSPNANNARVLNLIMPTVAAARGEPVPSQTPTITPTITITATATPAPTETAVPTVTATPLHTSTETPTPSPTATADFTLTVTPAQTATTTPSPAPTAIFTETPTASPAATRSPAEIVVVIPAPSATATLPPLFSTVSPTVAPLVPVPSIGLLRPYKVWGSLYGPKGNRMIRIHVADSLGSAVRGQLITISRASPSGPARYRRLARKRSKADGLAVYKPSQTGRYVFSLKTGEKSRPLTIRN